MNLIIFDICGTLYKSNTTFEFFRFLKPNYHSILFSLPFRVISKILRYFKIDILRYLVIKSLSGYSKDFLYEKALEFYDYFLVNDKQSEIIDLLEIQKNQGYVILASASIDPVVHAIAKRLGIASYLSSQLEYCDNMATGYLSNDLLGKKITALETQEIDLLVTDNKSDIDLFNISKRSIIISQERNLLFWEKILRKDDQIIIMK